MSNTIYPKKTENNSRLFMNNTGEFGDILIVRNGKEFDLISICGNLEGHEVITPTAFKILGVFVESDKDVTRVTDTYRCDSPHDLPMTDISEYHDSINFSLNMKDYLQIVSDKWDSYLKSLDNLRMTSHISMVMNLETGVACMYTTPLTQLSAGFNSLDPNFIEIQEFLKTVRFGVKLSVTVE